MLTRRQDAVIYQRAMAELRHNHPEEFKAIRQRMLTEAGMEIQSHDAEANRRAVLEEVVQHLQKGEAPTGTVVGRHVGLSSTSANKHINALVSDGVLEADIRGHITGVSRGIGELSL